MKIENAFLGALFAMMVLPPAATAQSSPEAGFTLEELVITARRREESLQEAPLSITGFDAGAVLNADIERVEDFLQLTSNVTIATSQGIGTSFISIRGQTQTRNAEAPVAVIVDGVLQVNSAQFRQELFDIESIQVAKGPQGAIYGRNATGGAIIIDTKKPSDQAEHWVNAGFGNGDERSVGASFSGPLADSLGGKITVNYIDRDGYLDNLTTGVEDDPFEDLAVRGRLVWEPSENFSADFIATVAEHDGRGIGFQSQVTTLAADGITGTGVFVFDPVTGALITDTGPLDADTVAPILSNNPDVGERDSVDLSLRLEWDTGIGTVTSTTAYNDLEEFSQADAFPYTAALSSPFGDNTQASFLDIEAISQELRITSSADQRFRWNAGIYWLSWDRFFQITNGLDLGLGIIGNEREPVPATSTINPSFSFFGDDNDNTARAIFGQVNYDVAEQLELSLALRFDDEERNQSVSPFNTGGVPGAENSASFNALQPKFTVRYTPSDITTLYATWGRGFRSGQFNANGVAAVAAGAGINGVEDIVREEIAESFEIGYKGLLANDRLRVNAALYDTDITDGTYFVFIFEVGAQVLVNIDDVSVFGGELDLTYAITDDLGIYAAYGFSDSEIEAYAIDPTQVGNEAPYVPGSTFNTGIQYTPSIGRGVDLLLRADFERRGSQFWDPENSTDRSALDLLNLRVGFQSEDWSLSFNVENATDEQFNSEFVTGGFSAAAPGRVWDVDLRYNF